MYMKKPISFTKALSLMVESSEFTSKFIRQFIENGMCLDDEIVDYYIGKNLSKAQLTALNKAMHMIAHKDNTIASDIQFVLRHNQYAQIRKDNKFAEYFAEDKGISYHYSKAFNIEASNHQHFITLACLTELWQKNGIYETAGVDAGASSSQAKNIIPEHVFNSLSRRMEIANGNNIATVDTSIPGNSLAFYQQYNFVCWVSYKDDAILGKKHLDSMPEGWTHQWARYEVNGLTDIYALDFKALKMFRPGDVDGYKGKLGKSVTSAKKAGMTFELWVNSITLN